MADKLKDMYFTRPSLQALAERIKQYDPLFDVQLFLSQVYDPTWESLELLARMHHTARCLGASLPADYRRAVQVLMQAAPGTTGYETLTFADFVEIYGLEHWEISLPALAFFTRLGSAELAVRAFLAQDLGRGMQFLMECAADPDPDVRRLASEGCRPRLPWGRRVPALLQDPAPILPILEKLKDDPSETVRRSVANNLNDISKDHPALALEVCERWYGQSAEVDRVVRHACRGLLKAGDPRALRLFGLPEPHRLAVENLSASPAAVRIGEELWVGFELLVEGDEEHSVRIDFAVYYVKASGKHSKKVFRWTEKSFPPGRHLLERKLSLADRTTRRHYPGEHVLAVVVNGKELRRTTIEVLAA